MAALSKWWYSYLIRGDDPTRQRRDETATTASSAGAARLHTAPEQRALGLRNAATGAPSTPEPLERSKNAPDQSASAGRGTWTHPTFLPCEPRKTHRSDCSRLHLTNIRTPATYIQPQQLTPTSLLVPSRIALPPSSFTMLSTLRIASRRAAWRPATLNAAAMRAASTWSTVPQGPPVS